MYFVYMIRNTDGKLYVGISVNPERRLLTHNTKRGAYFTKAFHAEKTRSKSGEETRKIL